MCDVKMMRAQGKKSLGIKYTPLHLIDKWLVKQDVRLLVDGQIDTPGIQEPV